MQNSVTLSTSYNGNDMKEEIILPQSNNPRVPEPEFPFRHLIPLQIRFNDIDMLGHLNNGVYLTFFDLGKARYFQEVFPQKIEWRKINIVVVNINCDFYAPTFIDEKIAVVTTVTHVGEKSLRLEQRIVNPESGEVKCLGRTTMAGINLATGKSAPLEPEWVAALEEYEGRGL